MALQLEEVVGSVEKPRGFFSFIPLRPQNPALAELLSLGEKEGSNMMDPATLLEAQACHWLSKLGLNQPTFCSLPELMFTCMNYLLGLCRNCKSKSTECRSPDHKELGFGSSKTTFLGHPGMVPDLPCPMFDLTFCCRRKQTFESTAEIGFRGETALSLLHNS